MVSMALAEVHGDDQICEWVCSLLSLLYGKRFDSHGYVESHGVFWVPNLAQFTQVCIPALPQNDHKERSDIGVPLDLREVARIRPLLMGASPDSSTAARAVTALKAAAKFYLQALQNTESAPEVAYLHLITAGEILANVHHPQSEDLLDECVTEILDDVRCFIPDGDKKARVLASQMRHIKRRFRLTVEDLIDDRFFQARDQRPQWARLNPKDLSSRVAAAYNLRSLYVHSGISFGHWISPRTWPHLTEKPPPGKPKIKDNKLAKELATVPTYIGLERVIRYCLLRFAERHKLFIDNSVLAH
jgi:hypothetical protein